MTSDAPSSAITTTSAFVSTTSTISTVISTATTTNALSGVITTTNAFTSATSTVISTATRTNAPSSVIITTTNAPSSALTTTRGIIKYVFCSYNVKIHFFILKKDLNPNASNITWLMSTIKAANQTTINLSGPTFMDIDDQNNFVVLSYYGNLVQMNRTTMSVIRSIKLGNDSAAFTYFNGYYFIEFESSYPLIYIYSTRNLTNFIAFINGTASNCYFRQVAFLQNNTIMVATVENLNMIQFYQISFSSFSTTLLFSIPALHTSPYSLYKVNDTFLYLVYYTSATPNYILSYNNSNNWTLRALNATKPAASEISAQMTIDSYGRIWLAIHNFGVRVFDSTASVLLYSWPISTGLCGILLMDNYELFFSDYDNNKTYHYKPNIN
ncbi:unnamed protein product [Didymodactylos carnosus]|uniref:Uncharacterized protein n=1 Tax=Didymodactylos carnosus TaxID=1234261 RepID=A0A8S2E2T3_9BILA|nr:unnamed protein product [Didymodactylos carnosus]CAF3836395.1 unnamed protein product [Didymodactylos carnosus]